jgi:hypothetical protein
MIDKVYRSIHELTETFMRSPRCTPPISGLPTTTEKVRHLPGTLLCVSESLVTIRCNSRRSSQLSGGLPGQNLFLTHD